MSALDQTETAMKYLSLGPSVGRRKLLSFGLVALMIGSVMGGALWRFGGVYVEPFLSKWEHSPLQRFSSYEELKSLLNRTSKAAPGSYRDWLFAAPEARFSPLQSSKAPDYSTTNIQVEGVDEADLVKTDGEYIYAVSGKSIFILRAYPPEDAEVLSRLDMNQTISGIFVNSDKLVVFQGGADPTGISLWQRIVPLQRQDTAWIAIKVYDVKDRSRPTLDRDVTVDGYYLSSRMIGDYVYALINQPAYLKNGEVDLPTIRFNDRVMDVPASSIYHLNTSDYYYTFTKILAFDAQDPRHEPRLETFLLGAATTVYVAQENIYIMSPAKQDATTIHKISIRDSEIVYAANGTVKGRVLNQFSMDEHKGYFRVATTKGNVWAGGASSRNNVYILNESLGVIGELEGLAPGEEIYSARFMGDKCYLVTFRKVDPLFVIDLKDPENPQVLGKLKIPGYSDYLHPYDENHLIGVGKETVAAEEGDFSWYQGVKISLFDVSNVSEPKEIAKVEIGDRGTDSPVLRDHKAFLFSQSKHLLVLPILLAEIDEKKYPYGVPPYASGEYVWQGAYVFDISRQGGIVLRGRITHLDGQTDPMKSGNSIDSRYEVKRSLYIDDVLYTISDKRIKMNALDDLTLIKMIELP